MSDGTDDFVFVGFWKRVLAYLIDMIPIFIVVFCIFYFFLGYDETLATYLNDTHNIESRKKFLIERNHVRDLSFFAWIFYGMIMDCSRFQGTHGKMFLGIKVTDKNRNRISFSQSLIRMIMKIVGALAICIGYLWVAFRKDKAGWHDLAAQTCVVNR